MPYRIHREPEPHERERARNRRRRDPHDGDRRTCGCRRGVRTVVRRPGRRGLGALLRRRRHHDPMRARGRHRLARARRQCELDRNRARRLRRPASARLERRLQSRGRGAGREARRPTCASATGFRSAGSGQPSRRRAGVGSPGTQTSARRSARATTGIPAPTFPWTRFLRLSAQQRRRRAPRAGRRRSRPAPRA